jgi:predicted dehydrogenase
MAGKLRWGILGTGNIARQFTAGVNASQRAIAAAVGSRNIQTAEEFGRTFEIPRLHGSYAALVADAEIDAVYISLPNSLHCQWTIQAIEHGKHVLCEKPLALNLEQGRRMFDAAGKADRVLMEAFMYRSHPQTLEVIEAVRGGAIGRLRLVRASFCYHTRRIDGNVRFVRELGGGGLMDIGCYCIDFARLFAGREPSAMSAIAKFHSSGVDELAVGFMDFPGEIAASFTCGMCLEADNTAYLCGSEGFIEIPVPWKPMPGNARFIVTRGTPPRMDNPKSVASTPPRDVRMIESSGNLYAIEADDFAACVLDGQQPRISREDSLGNLRVLDEMRRQIGLEF